MPKSGANVTTSAGPVTLAISYDASEQSYTVSDGTRSRTFGPGNVDAAQSNDSITTYKVTSGNTTDFLSLTKPGTGPGQTRYVAGGFWQRQVDGSQTIDGRFTAFTYGVQTPDGSLPRSGVASFDVKMIGAHSFEALISNISGSGVLNLDFASGAIAARGRYDEADVTSGQGVKDINWSARARVSSSGNSFNGSLTLDNIGTGELRGTLFGPGAEEVGGVFSMRSDQPQQAAVGAIYGARGTSPVNTGDNVVSVPSDTFFTPVSASIAGQLDASGKPSALSAGPPLVSVLVEPPSSRYVVYDRDGRTAIVPPPRSGGSRLTSDYLDPGSSAMRGVVLLDRANGRFVLDSFVFGRETPLSDMPRTGSALYTVNLLGGVAAQGTELQTLVGQGGLSIDFLNGPLTGSGTYTVYGTYPGQGIPNGTVDSGTWTSSAMLTANSNRFSGSLSLDGGADYSGTVKGGFYDDKAAALGGVFDLLGGSGSAVVGVIAGKPDANAISTQKPLTEISSPTELRGQSIAYFVEPNGANPTVTTDEPIRIAYDPATGTYAFSSDANPSSAVGIPIATTITAANKVPAGSDASFTAYKTASTDGRLLNPGSANPTIALTHVSFADLNVTGTKDGKTIKTEYFVPFGVVTPNAQMPRSGSATFAGVVFGRGTMPSFSRDVLVSGTNALAVNFGTGSWSSILSLTAADRTSGEQRAIGDFTFAGSELRLGNGIFASNPTFSATPGGGFVTGFLAGRFYGPQAQEFGGAFDVGVNPGTGQASDMSRFFGAMVGKRN